jgi:hypothetical protein
MSPNRESMMNALVGNEGQIADVGQRYLRRLAIGG